VPAQRRHDPVGSTAYQAGDDPHAADERRHHERVVDRSGERRAPHGSRGTPPPSSARWTGSRVATIAPLKAIPTAWPLTRIWASVPDAVPTRGRGTEPSTALLLGLMNMP